MFKVPNLRSHSTLSAYESCVRGKQRSLSQLIRNWRRRQRRFKSATGHSLSDGLALHYLSLNMSLMQDEAIRLIGWMLETLINWLCSVKRSHHKLMVNEIQHSINAWSFTLIRALNCSSSGCSQRFKIVALLANTCREDHPTWESSQNFPSTEVLIDSRDIYTWDWLSYRTDEAARTKVFDRLENLSSNSSQIFIEII